MQSKMLLLIIPVAVVAAAVFSVIPLAFPPVGCGIASTCPPPSPSTFPHLMFLDFWDALAAGVGVAFLVYGAVNYSKWPQAIRGPLLLIFFIALWFTLLNWIHDGWHKVNGMNLNGLIAIEYVFHVPWLIFGGVLVYSLTRIVHAYQKK